ncbi:MAG TPA: ferredoxin family protein [Candidatus Acetothermia bacterium]|nr:ferredoxin family protein [Candidatus Acetothermia bacterium]
MTEKVQEKLVKRWKVPGGYILLLEDHCKGCGFCHTFCPRKVLREAEHYNAKGYHPPEVVDPDACVLCGFCQDICPEFAIWIEREEGTKKDEGSRG